MDDRRFKICGSSYDGTLHFDDSTQSRPSLISVALTRRPPSIYPSPRLITRRRITPEKRDRLRSSSPLPRPRIRVCIGLHTDVYPRYIGTLTLIRFPRYYEILLSDNVTRDSFDQRSARSRRGDIPPPPSVFATTIARNLTASIDPYHEKDLSVNSHEYILHIYIFLRFLNFSGYSHITGATESVI